MRVALLIISSLSFLTIILGLYFIYKLNRKIRTLGQFTGGIGKNGANQDFPSWIAYQPELVPSLQLMRTEGIDVLEEWFRWAEEWSLLLRLYGKITPNTKMLEIGCGLGRIVFPLRYILSSEGSYSGFEICEEKVDFLNNTFHKAYPNFNFVWANIHNTYYNPNGKLSAKEYTFPYPDNSFDVVFAASVFTHMLPEAAANYFKETARVLKPDGRAVFSFFILNNYNPKQPRPKGFARPGFNFDYPYESYSDNFAISNPTNSEEMTAYKINFIEKLCEMSGMELERPPINGLWSGTNANWITTQDLVILKKIM